MSKKDKCPKCGAFIFDENATFCRECHAVLKGRKTRWMIP